MKRKVIQNSLVTPDGTILLSLDGDIKAHKDANGEVYYISGGLSGDFYKSNNEIPGETLYLYSDSSQEDFLDKLLLNINNRPVRLKNIDLEGLQFLFDKAINKNDLESIFISTIVLAKLEIDKLSKQVTVEAKPAYLFTTEDGVKMFEGDTWWSVVLDGVRIPKETKTMEYKGSNPSKNVVTFSSKELAYKAALEGMDRAQVLTLNDVAMNIGQLDRLEKIAKNRFLNSHPVKEKDSDKKYSREDIILLLENSGAFAKREYVTKFVDSVLK